MPSVNVVVTVPLVPVVFPIIDTVGACKYPRPGLVIIIEVAVAIVVEEVVNQLIIPVAVTPFEVVGVEKLNEIVDVFATVNNVAIKIETAARRAGDVESSVVDKVSNYMKSTYSLCQLLKIQENI